MLSIYLYVTYSSQFVSLILPPLENYTSENVQSLSAGLCSPQSTLRFFPRAPLNTKVRLAPSRPTRQTGVKTLHTSRSSFPASLRKLVVVLSALTNKAHYLLAPPFLRNENASPPPKPTRNWHLSSTTGYEKSSFSTMTADDSARKRGATPSLPIQKFYLSRI